MNKLLIGFLMLGSIASTYAQDSVRTFRDPSINNILFSSNSSPTAVCNYLGYAEAVSTFLESRLSDAVVVNDKGITGSAYATSNELVSVFTRITCKNPTNSKSVDLQIPTLIKNPSHPRLNKVISRDSSEDGVCKLLGYQRAAGGTLGKLIYPGSELQIINGEGQLIGEDLSSGSMIRKIICL